MGWGVFGDLGGAIKGAAKAVGGDIPWVSCWLVLRCMGLIN